MNRIELHREEHLIHRVGWLRAAVMGANDGILSTASLIAGVAAAGAGTAAILTAGVAGLVGGAMSMAAGEYVSVSSQTDTEQADLARETKELAEQWPEELAELTEIYEKRGLQPALAKQVAEALMAGDALSVHAREELGMTETTQARPVQAAITSALTFSAGAALPLLAAWLAPQGSTVVVVAIATIISLAALGAVGARAGGAGMVKGAARVAFWGVLALAVTSGIGALFGTVV
ncbi:MAG TPA: VIT family protein [Devosia sp.]|nr:VIT family protein [Devosia sp.]